MQPKTPKPTYSIILMRDDCDVSAFRLHSFWVKLFIITLVILIGACIAGAYGTFYYKNRYQVTAADRRELQRTLGENKIKLESLSNEELVGRFTGTGPAGPNAGNSVVSPNNGSANPTTVAGNSGNQNTAMPSQEDLAKLLGQLGPDSAAGVSGSTAEADAQMEKHPVKVSNLKVAFEGENRIRTTYDLSNQQPGLTLVGRCSIALITRDGAIIDVTPSARGVLSFQIARFRKMDILAQIPPNVKQDDIVKVQISAQANDLPRYFKQFAVETSS